MQKCEVLSIKGCQGTFGGSTLSTIKVDIRRLLEKRIEGNNGNAMCRSDIDAIGG